MSSIKHLKKKPANHDFNQYTDHFTIAMQDYDNVVLIGV